MEKEKKGFFEAVRLGKNHPSSYLFVFLAVVLGYVIGQLPLTLVILQRSLGNEELDSSDAMIHLSETGDFSIFGLDPNFSLFLVLLSFVGGLVMLILAVKVFHKRSPLTLINYSGRVRLGRVAFGFFVWIFLCFLVEIIFIFLDPTPYEFTFSFTPFIILLVIALLILPLQTSFEELFFRGWLMQGFGYLFENKLSPLFISSLLFALIHSANPEVAKYGYLPMMSYYLMAGLFLALITILDESLELALGVHFATNFYSAVFFSYEGAALQTPALFRSTEDVNILNLNIAFVCIAAVFVWMAAKKYHWNYNSLFERFSIEKE